MPVWLAEALVSAATGYAMAGLAVGIAFLLFGLDRTHPAARGAHAFRPLLLPGLALLWPLVLRRWAGARAVAVLAAMRVRHRRAHLRIWIAMLILLPALLAPAWPARRPLRRGAAPSLAARRIAMSARYVPIGWTPAKRAYDLVLVVGTVGYLLAYLHLGPMFGDPELDGQSLAMKAYGSCAFLLLTAALAIGPLARLDHRFLPLLYNRRHLGVVAFLVALSHALEALGWHFAFSAIPSGVAMLSSEPVPGAAPGLPFVPFGVVALLILFALAATSHDFWLSFLTDRRAEGGCTWRSYRPMRWWRACGLRALQSATTPALAILVLGGARGRWLRCTLAAALRERRTDAQAPAAAKAAPGSGAGAPTPCRKAAPLPCARRTAKRSAIIRNDGPPLGRQPTCVPHLERPAWRGADRGWLHHLPWHGFQFRPEDGLRAAALHGTARDLQPRAARAAAAARPAPQPARHAGRAVPVPGAAP
jgi:hypothetical protein